MIMANDLDHDRLHELLTAKATQPLSPGDERELEALLLEFPHVDATALDRAAAAVDVAHLLATRLEPMPESVRRRVQSSAVAFAARSRGNRS